MTLELFVGIAIGFALGILTMVSIKEHSKASKENLDDLDEQIHGSGFINIPEEQLQAKFKNYNPEVRGAFQNRIQRFKARNRFYR